MEELGSKDPAPWWRSWRIRNTEKVIWVTMEPSFPLAAEIPCAVDRYRVGNASPGITNVVVLGPKFSKKFAMQTSAKKAFVAVVLLSLGFNCM